MQCHIRINTYTTIKAGLGLLCFSISPSFIPLEGSELIQLQKAVWEIGKLEVKGV